jgi:hypothetical protein
MNVGVIGHEYAHRVFNHKAGGGLAFPSYLSTNYVGEAMNIVKSIDEGFADFHGYGVTCATDGVGGPGCDTAFLEPSFGTATVVKDRDFSLEDKCLSVELRTALTSLTTDTFVSEGQQYKVGTLFAASLYQAANKSGKVEVMEKALVAAYDDENLKTPGFKQVFDANVDSPHKITLEKVVDVILSHVTDPDLQRATCNELWERLDLQLPTPDGSLTHCPPTSMRGSMNCPVLPTP